MAKLARLGHIGPAGPPNDFQIIKWAPDPMKHGFIFILCTVCIPIFGKFMHVCVYVYGVDFYSKIK